jgi:hypothetical protein
MNSTQIQSLVAPLVTFFAGLLAGKGVFGLDATSWTTIIGGIAGTVATVWGVVATRQTALVSTVAAMPEVKSVSLTPMAPQALVDATPSNVTK